MATYLLRLGSDACPDQNVNPNSSSQWNEKTFSLKPKKSNRALADGDIVYIWVHESDPGNGLTARATISELKKSDVEITFKALNTHMLGPLTLDDIEYPPPFIKRIALYRHDHAWELTSQDAAELEDLARHAQDRSDRKLPNRIERSALETAIREIRDGRMHTFAESTDYDVEFEGAYYPPKAVVGVAASNLAGTEFGPGDFVGGRGTQCFAILEVAGFKIIAKTEDSVRSRRPKARIAKQEIVLPKLNFRLGQTYHRKRDIHGVFGGQEQGGICTPANSPLIFIFTGGAGEQHGYADGWDGGTFLYFGEGQIGPMRFIKGNRALRDHAVDGKEILLFSATRASGEYRFMGHFNCGSWEIRTSPDRDGNARDAIVFHLVPTDASADSDNGHPERAASQITVDIEELRRRAYAATSPPNGTPGKSGKRIYYERSAAVRDYVLARAKGLCECCKQSAPFLRKDGSPYLEPHHIRRVSDGGPDHPKWVAAICPSCHREIHCGAEGAQRNNTLLQYVEKLEPD